MAAAADGSSASATKGVVRTYEEELAFIKARDDVSFTIDRGFVPNMNVSRQQARQ